MTIPSPAVMLPIAAALVRGAALVVLALVILTASAIGAGAVFVVTLAAGLSKMLAD